MRRPSTPSSGRSSRPTSWRRCTTSWASIRSRRSRTTPAAHTPSSTRARRSRKCFEKLLEFDTALGPTDAIIGPALDLAPWFEDPAHLFDFEQDSLHILTVAEDVLQIAAVADEPVDESAYSRGREHDLVRRLLGVIPQ